MMKHLILFISGTNNTMIKLACNVPVDDYFTTETVFDNSAVSQTGDNIAQEINGDQSTVTMTFKPTTANVPNLILDYRSTNAPPNNKTLVAIKNVPEEHLPNNVSSSVDNGPNRGPPNAHIVRVKKKQKTEIKANIDETDKHVVSGFEVIETYEEEEEWVDELKQDETKSNGKHGRAFMKNHLEEPFTHGKGEHKATLSETHRVTSPTNSNRITIKNHNKHAHSEYMSKDTTTLAQGTSNRKMKQASSHDISKSPMNAKASSTSFHIVSIGFLMLTSITWNTVLAEKN